MRQFRGELALDARARLGEGPVWDEREGRLVWTDIPAGAVHAFRPGSGDSIIGSLDRDVGIAVPRAARPGFVLAMREGFGLLDESFTSLAAPLGSHPELRMNDGACDPQGRFWAGSMAYDLSPGRASLFRLDPDGTVTEVLTGLGLANGVAWSPEGDTMYLVDSLARRVDAFSYDGRAGLPGNSSVVVALDSTDGYPDGLAVDREGCLWLAVWGAGEVRRYTPTGEVDSVVRLPVSQVTSCAFGGRGSTELYVTSAREGLPEAELASQPAAGGVFIVDVGVTGSATFSFAG